jgi:acetyl esterase/lipase
MAHGWSAALPGYTLAPDSTLAQMVGEVGSALDWLAAEGPGRGLAERAIVVSGWSAGAHLAAMALGHPAVAAGLAISGVFDLAPLRDTYLDEKLRLTDSEAWPYPRCGCRSSRSLLRFHMAPQSFPRSSRTAATSTSTEAPHTRQDR